ncbi:MAG: extradiol ring-cleavage dioxygenase [Acidimicrobiales bacterium]
MAEVQLLGITHYPPFGWADPHMAGIHHALMADPAVPAEATEPGRWPAEQQAEWGDDGGVAAAADHRAALIAGLDRVRAELEAFDPDVIVVWGDDQYENFTEDLIPAMSILAYPDREVFPYRTGVGERFPSYWADEGPDTSRLIRGRPDVARDLAGGLLGAGFDIAYAYRPLHDDQLPHAFLNAVLFLDHDRRGFDWPIIAMPINCYGARVVAAHGAWRPFGQELEPDPPSPNPSRLMDMGAAVARHLHDSPHRVTLLASSSWSHAFLVDHNWRMRPDTPADRRLYEAMVAGDFDTWEKMSTDDIVRAGQQEVLNWFAVVGAARELGADLAWSEFVETWIFNSNKVFAAWTPVGGTGGEAR